MRRLATATIAILLTATSQRAQDRAPNSPSPPNEIEGTSTSGLITIPAGTRIPVSLLIPIHSKSARRGDLVHLETQYPVIVGTEIAIPAATYVEGVIDKVITKRDSGSPATGLQMHFTRLSFTNGYEVRLDRAILQADCGAPTDTTADIFAPMDSAEPGAFAHSAFNAGSDARNFGLVGFQAHGNPTKPPKPKPSPPKGPGPTPPPPSTPTPVPTPPPAPTPPPTPTPTPPPTPSPPPAPTPPAPTPPTTPTPTPTPAPTPTISSPGSSVGAGVGVGIGAVAAAIGGVFMAKHRGEDTVIEEGTQFYVVLQTAISVDRQRVVDAAPE
jgi:hypothetical protein